MRSELKDIGYYAEDRIEVAALSRSDYISTENMLPNKSGIEYAVSLPSTRMTQAFQVGDVLISNIRPYFKKIWYATFAGGCSNDVLVVRARNHVDSKFLYYLLTEDKFFDYVMASSKGTKMPRGDKSAIMQYGVQVPPLDVQQRIAHILGTLDDKIELNRQMNKTLDEIARTHFRSWFVDFDPVRAKIEGLQPNGMDAATAALFPNRLIDSELGPIPEGWEVKPIGEMVTVVGGGTPSTKQPEYWDGGTHLWATPKDLSGLEFPILINTARKVTDAGVERISSRMLPEGSVLLSSRAPVGYLAINDQPTAINQGFIGMICDQGVPNYYILDWTRQNMETIKSNAGGTTFAEISKTAFRPIPGVVPSPLVLNAYREAVAPLFALMTSNLHESQTLAELRDTLLPELRSAQLLNSEMGVVG